MTLAILIAALLRTAEANERQFTYTYDTSTLPRGAREIEPWTTIGLEDGTSLTQRMELEWGVSDKLLSAFYLNWHADGAGSAFDGVSSEWKLGLASRSVAPVGVALYGEASLGPAENELEFKLLLDRQRGDVLLAVNLVAEAEWKDEGEERWEAEQVGEVVLGAAWKPGPWSVGVEALEKNELVEGALAELKVGAGPALSVAQEGWWAAATAMVWFAEKEGDEELEMGTSPEIRLLLGFDY